MRAASLLILGMLLSFSTQVFSAQVLKVKGSAILIDTAGDNLQMGQMYYLVSGGKKKGLVKILKLRPGQALGKLLKGNALPNWTLLSKNARGNSKAKSSQAARSVKPQPPKSTARKSIPSSYKNRRRATKRSRSSTSKFGLGLALGFSQNSSTVKFLDLNGSPTRTDSYSGSSLSYEFVADYQLYNKIYLRSSLGFQNFLAEDTSNTQCEDSNDQPAACSVDLGYINFDIWARYMFNQGNYRFWAGAGMGFLFSPKFNNTTALNEEDLATTTLIQIGGGADITVSDRLYVPVWAEYGLYPSSDTVEMNSISFYAGLAYKL